MTFDDVPQTEKEKADMLRETLNIERGVLSGIQAISRAFSAINSAGDIWRGTPSDYSYVDEEADEVASLCDSAWDELQDAMTYARKALNEIREDRRYINSYQIPSD